MNNVGPRAHRSISVFCLFDIYHHLRLLLSTPLRNMSDIYGLACLTGSILKWYIDMGPPPHSTPLQGNIRNELALFPLLSMGPFVCFSEGHHYLIYVW